MTVSTILLVIALVLTVFSLAPAPQPPNRFWRWPTPLAVPLLLTIVAVLARGA